MSSIQVGKEAKAKEDVDRGAHMGTSGGPAGLAAAATSPATCQHCKNQCGRPLRCGACKLAIYCSEACQQKDWRSHRIECKLLSGAQKREQQVDAGKQSEVFDTIEEDSGVMELLKGIELLEEPDEAHISNKELCRNCANPCEKVLRCGKCRSVSYCSAFCQKEDWQFHKRGCKRPEEKEKELAVAAAQVARRTSKELEEAPQPLKDRNMYEWWVDRLVSQQLVLDMATSSAGGLTVERIGDVEGESLITYKHGSAQCCFDLSFQIYFSLEPRDMGQANSDDCGLHGLVKVMGFSHKGWDSLQTDVCAPEAAAAAAKTHLLPKIRSSLVACVEDFERQAEEK